MADQDWRHLMPYGYAPGNYMNRCHTCNRVTENVDKRAITCRPCAEARHASGDGVALPQTQQEKRALRIPVLKEA